jgi:hypothetical protein
MSLTMIQLGVFNFGEDAGEVSEHPRDTSKQFFVFLASVDLKSQFRGWDN